VSEEIFLKFWLYVCIMIVNGTVARGYTIHLDVLESLSEDSRWLPTRVTSFITFIKKKFSTEDDFNVHQPIKHRKAYVHLTLCLS
jgi:hypothetical protein